MEFMIPVKETQAALIPQKGDIVTFQFDHFSRKSLPVNPAISRLRFDLSWNDVLRDFANSSKLGNSHSFIFYLFLTFASLLFLSFFFIKIINSYCRGFIEREQTNGGFENRTANRTISADFRRIFE